jgi:hypothetical protein
VCVCVCVLRVCLESRGARTPYARVPDACGVSVCCEAKREALVGARVQRRRFCCAVVPFTSGPALPCQPSGYPSLPYVGGYKEAQTQSFNRVRTQLGFAGRMPLDEPVLSHLPFNEAHRHQKKIPGKQRRGPRSILRSRVILRAQPFLTHGVGSSAPRCRLSARRVARTWRLDILRWPDSAQAAGWKPTVERASR